MSAISKSNIIVSFFFINKTTTGINMLVQHMFISMLLFVRKINCIFCEFNQHIISVLAWENFIISLFLKIKL